MLNSNEIYEPNHLDSEKIIVESYYDTDDSTASSSNSVSTKRESFKWVELEKFTDLELADDRQ